jgi:hypothetical protein
MKNGRIFAIVGSALLGTVLMTAESARAQAPYVGKATVYQVKMVRAMDECTGPFITVVNPGGTQGCAQVNVITDTNTAGGLTAIAQGNLKVSRRGGSGRGAYIRFTGKGFAPVGTDVAVQLTLRVTNTLGTPVGSKTYEDTTIICGELIGGSCGNFSTVLSNGQVRLRQSLDDCLAANGLSSARLGEGNIEIVESALINCDTGKVAGRPGILQGP